jgi:hypothetical protein
MAYQIRVALFQYCSSFVRSGGTLQKPITTRVCCLFIYNVLNVLMLYILIRDPMKISCVSRALYEGGLWKLKFKSAK